MKIRVVAMTLLAILLIPVLSGAADLKVGVLDFQKIFQTYEGFGEAMSIYNKDLEGWQSEKQKMIDELVQARGDLSRQRPLLTPEALNERESDLSRLEAELYQFEQEKFGPDGEALRRDMELSEPIYEKIREVVKSVAEEESYDLILDVSGAVIYAHPDMDMDDKISAALHARG